MLILATLLAALALTASQAEAASLQDAVELMVEERKTIHEVTLNDLIDENMNNIREFLMAMDPLDLLEQDFKVMPGAYMKLHTGWLQNLSLLKRSGLCQLRYSEKKLNLDLNFGWKDVVFDYRYLLRMFLVKRTGDLHGQMTDLKVNVVLDIDFNNYHVTLKSLDFVHTGNLKIKLEGHLTDPIYNTIIKTVTFFARQLVLNTIQARTSHDIKLMIEKLNIAIGQHRSKQFTFESLVKLKELPIDYVPNEIELH